MEAQRVYEDVLTKAETLPLEELSRLIGELSRIVGLLLLLLEGSLRPEVYQLLIGFPKAKRTLTAPGLDPPRIVQLAARADTWPQ
ncbi:MAG TPA: hypothetical protein VGX03_33075 [Candidatus Binatia bacterium]|jgi:hypothetical protein|nr:hypothetical protein [Candidatus Binatia bacterium]